MNNEAENFLNITGIYSYFPTFKTDFSELRQHSGIGSSNLHLVVNKYSFSSVDEIVNNDNELQSNIKYNTILNLKNDNEIESLFEDLENASNHKLEIETSQTFFEDFNNNILITSIRAINMFLSWICAILLFYILILYSKVNYEEDQKIYTLQKAFGIDNYHVMQYIFFKNAIYGLISLPYILLFSILGDISLNLSL